MTMRPFVLGMMLGVLTLSGPAMAERPVPLCASDCDAISRLASTTLQSGDACACHGCGSGY